MSVSGIINKIVVVGQKWGQDLDFLHRLTVAELELFDRVMNDQKGFTELCDKLIEVAIIRSADGAPRRGNEFVTLPELTIKWCGIDHYHALEK